MPAQSLNVNHNNLTIIRFHPPAENQRGPTFLESYLESWVSLVGHEGIRLGISSDRGQLTYLLDVPASRQRFVAAQIENAYPGGKSEVVQHTDATEDKSRTDRSAGLRLSPDAYPLKLHQSFVEDHSRDSHDPIESLLETSKRTGWPGAFLTAGGELIAARRA